MEFFEEAGSDGNIFHQVRIHLEFIKNTQSIRTGVEKYLGLIAGRKFTVKAEIERMDREARGGLMCVCSGRCGKFLTVCVSREALGAAVHETCTCK